MKRLMPLLVLVACAELPSATKVRCVSDAECSGTQVCFATGCGDPGTGIVAEVTGNSVSLHAQDLAISNLSANLPLEIQGPLSIAGTLVEVGRTGTANYVGGVTLTARGSSTLIPGLPRSYSLTLAKTDNGVYQLFTGAGAYTVTARPAEAGVPYQTVKGVRVAPGSPSGAASFEFPALDTIVYLNGTLVARVEPGHPEKIVYQDGLSVQAFDSSGLPLSQVARVLAMGTFTLALDFTAANLSTITLVATPYDNTALAPTKIFVVPLPQGTTTLGRLELGDFGDRLPLVPGRLVNASGAPVAFASVTLEGRVGGGGTLKTPTVTTDSDGNFSVDLLPTPPDSAYTLTAIPPPGPSGILQLQVHAGLVNGSPAFKATANATQAKTQFVCPDRIVTAGRVLDPDGAPAQGVRVQALAVESLDMRPVPSLATETTTDAEGRFALLLDPARYRLDYVPAAKLPRKSRLVRVESMLDADAGTPLAMNLGEFQLSLGRTVSGHVTVVPNVVTADGGAPTVGGGAPAQNAVVRFYRVTAVEGVDQALLIGETVTDERGTYQVTLPDRGTSPAPAP